MGRTWDLACTCAFLLVFLCASSEGKVPDADMSQKEMELMSQKEVELVDLWEPEEEAFIMQREVTGSLSPDLIRALKETERSRAADTHEPQVDVTLTFDEDVIPGGRSIVRPRSFGPKILFPPGQPSPSNLQAICLHGNQRPRYPASSLPQSGFGHLYRQADAVNRLESWYGVCCHGNGTQDQEVTLCCTRQAWKQSLSQFCEDEFSIKTRHYHCCKKKDGARLRCFHGDAPNPAYLPINQEPESLMAPDTGFTFDPSACQRSAPGPRSVQGRKERKPIPATTREADISFPPGRPTTANIDSICRFRKLRPLYMPKCLPRVGYGWLARQAKAVNRLERGFKHCCKGQEERLGCADGKWSEVLDRFCEEEGTARRFPCCETPAGEKRYDCFSARAPHPGYGRELHSPTTPPQDPALGHICQTHKIVKKKFNVGFPVQRIVSQCCPLPADQRTPCVQEKLSTLSERLCRGTSPSPSGLRCCSHGSQDAPGCFSSLLMDAVTKAIKSPRIRKRKCPLSEMFVSTHH